MTSADWLKFISLILGFIVSIATYILSNRSNLATQRNNIYLGLEVEACRLFEIARSDRRMIGFLEGDYVPADQEEQKELYHKLCWYVPQVLNIFELSISFYKNNVFEKDVFVTWIAWYFELSSSQNFPTFWQGLRLHYKLDLRNLMDAGLKAPRQPPNAALQCYFKMAADIMRDKSIYEYYQKCLAT